jgi:hypothetical protein
MLLHKRRFGVVIGISSNLHQPSENPAVKRIACYSIYRIGLNILKAAGTLTVMLNAAFEAILYESSGKDCSKWNKREWRAVDG